MENIIEKLDEMTARRIRTSPHLSNRASECGHPCMRFLVLSRLSPELKAMHDVGLQRIFDEGRLHEDAMLRELQDAGYRIVEQQRHLEWKQFQLTGSIDAKLALNGDLYPLELKSCSPNIFPHIKEAGPEEMLNSRFSWVRKYPAQLLIYMLLCNEKTGLMIFKNKVNGEKCLKVFELTDANLAYAETILKKLEVVNEWVRKGEAPPAERIPDCEGCGFAKTSCFVGADYGPGFELMMDAAELEAKLDRRAELAAAAKEYSELDDEIKEQFKGRSAVVGSWKVESRPYEMTTYAVPKEVKAQYAEKRTAYKTIIEKI